MNKKQSLIQKLSLAGLAGVMVAGAGSVTAETFDASASVTTAITVTQDQAMSFGSLFASNAGDQTAANGWTYLTLSPTGTLTEDSNGSAPALLSLGGQQPAQATLSGVATAQITLQFPDNTIALDSTAALSDTGTSGNPASTLAHESGNPGVGGFELYNFTAGDATGTTAAPAAGAANSGTYTLTPSFGVTDVTFAIGATLVTDGSGSDYQDGNYTGTFDVTASY